MTRLRFCADSINILVQLKDMDIVEIKPIAGAVIRDVKTNLEKAVFKCLDEPNEDPWVYILADFGLT